MSKDQDDELEYQFSSEDEYEAGRNKTQRSDSGGDYDNKSSEKEFENTNLGGRTPSMGLVDRLSFLKNKRVIFIVFAIIIALVYFKMTQPDFNNNKIVNPVVKSKKVTPPVSNVNMAHYALTDKVNSLEKSLNNSEGSYSVLQNKLNTVNDTLSEMVASQKQLYKAVTVLATEYNNMREKLKKKKAKPSPAPPPLKTKIWSPSKVFTLHAAIPGRAWLEDNHHLFSTVAVGDVLPGYGKILEIDVDNNRVVTSSGYIIKTASR